MERKDVAVIRTEGFDLQPSEDNSLLNLHDEFIFSRSERAEDFVEKVGGMEIFTSIGVLNSSSLIRTPYFIQLKNLDPIADEGILAKKYFQHADTLFQMLWLIRDCSCNAIISTVYRINTRAIAVYNNQSVFTNASGLHSTVQFSIEEIETVKDYTNKYLELAPNVSSSDRDKSGKDFFDEEEGFSNEYKSTPYFLHKDYKRIHRAKSFLDNARTSLRLPEKISFYILCLECLFSDDSTEVAYRVSERVALYLGETTKERYDIFNDVKDYYGIRSKYFHGDVLDKKFKTYEKLEDASINIDQIVRRVFVKMLFEYPSKFSLEKDDLRSWYLSLSFRK
jgi:hypothetical protein